MGIGDWGLGQNKNFKLINTINDIKINWYTNAICNIKDNILLIAGEGIYIIDIQKCQVINKIYRKFNLDGIASIIQLENGNILIGSDYLLECKYENNNLINVKWNTKAHNLLRIDGLLEMKDGTIISCSVDKTIKFWK